MEDLRSRQLNPNNELYWKTRGFEERPHDWEERMYGNSGDNSEDDSDDESEEFDDEDGDEFDEEEDNSDSEEEDNSDSEEEDNSDSEESEDDSELDEYNYAHALESNQQNPNNIEFWKLRGWSYRPDDWRGKCGV